MSRPTLDDIAALAGSRVELTVPKPREDQRLVGTVVAEGAELRLRLDDGTSENHATVRLKERERDGVVRAFRGTDGDLLVGRVKRIDEL
ncbi:hypothetical protein GJ631_09205 [Natronomonas sp. CBA1123]|uniref:hypothetical protein n=1 Tax=Natronomonas sp. CBA1123 TaxID=2668070 RepID=UPI0012EA2167|nr:hypothetical protein [Natronomonas sp. CBA1123]MUV86739.1 hypothetical protein [Natronomonas sp. CBA1123]